MVDEFNKLFNNNNLAVNKTIEEIIYREVFKPTKELRQMPENYAYAYYRYREILFELKNIQKQKLF